MYIFCIFQLYVGNLTWWTSDQDIQDAVSGLGVDDFLEVKFYENKINGQSKGFCCVSLGSERSMQKVLEEMPKKELHSQLPVVSYPTRQALYQFESQSKTRPPPSGQGQGGGGGSGGRPSGPPPPGRDSRPPPHHHPPPYGGDRGRGPPHHGPPPSGYPPPPAPSYGRPPPHALPPPMSRPPPSMPPMMAPGIPPPAPYHHPPAAPVPHVNPAFIPGAPPGLHPPPGPAPPAVDPREFEDVMARNRTVSSSAIARAVQDAASGEFGSAIETLVTAISLIKQSKVADDDRCRILISSLQDTLQGIENKSYSAGSRRRERSRSPPPPRREYREREYERDHYRPREYSRDFDREREYRSRREDYHHHRESRDKYYEDRYRGREESSRSRGRDDVIDERDRH